MFEYWNPRIERMPIKDLHKLQEERLRTIARYVYDHSSFYRQRFREAGVEPEDIKELSDVTKLPFTTKIDLRNTYPTGMFCLPKDWVVRYHVSSGTTGKPTVVGYTQGDIDMWTDSLARALTSIGLGRGDVIQVSYGYGLFTGGLGLHYGAEPWSDETRRRIEESTGIKAYDIYGTSEMSGPLCSESHLQNGIHIWADLFLIEAIDPKTGEQVAEGERGELVVTTLDKWAFPLIRYRIGDLTIVNNEPCECGRTHPRIMRILGRTDDMIIVRGINVFPSQVESVLMKIPEIGDNYMIIVDRKGPLDVMTVKVEVTESAFSDKIADLMSLSKAVSQQLKGVLNIMADVELVEPGTIPRSEGKAQRVIDNREV